MKKFSIQFKVTLLVVAALLVTAVVSTCVSAFLMYKEEGARLESTRSIMTRDKVEALSDKTKIAYQVINIVYQELQKEANKDGYRTTYTGEVGTIQEQGVTASFTNTKSDFPYTGDDNLVTISKMGLMVSVPLAFVFSGLYGILTARKRKNQQ